MTRVNSLLVLLPVVTVLGACGSSATAPNNTTPTTTYYAGIFASPAATGSFAATSTTPASSEVLAALSADRMGSGLSSSGVRPLSSTSMTVVVTLINPAKTFTLTGSVTGTSFTVSDNSNPPNTCTGTIGNELNATCSILGFTNLTFLGAVVPAAAQGQLVNYCGFETPTGGGAADAAVFLGIAGASSFISRIALASGSESFYLDQTATPTSIVDSLLGSTTDYFTGSYTAPLWSGNHTSPGSPGTWGASTNGCAVTTASVMPSSVTFTTPVNTTAPNQTVMVQGGSVGPITAIVPQQAASWLTATVSGTTVTLAVTPMATPTTLPFTAGVNVYAEFANNGPLPIAVTYNVTSVAAPVLAAASPNLGFNWTQGTANPVAQSDLITSTGGTPATGLSATVSYGTPPAGFTGTQSWLSTFNLSSTTTPATLNAAVTTTGLVVGQYLAVVTITSTIAGVNPLHLGVTLNVVSSTGCTITNPLVPGQNYATLDPLSVGTYATIPLTFTGNCGGTGSINWLTSAGSLPAGMEFEPDENVIAGIPTAGGSYNFTLELGGTSPPTTLPFAGNVNAVSQACVMGPVPAGLPAGQSGQSYGVGFLPSGFYESSLANSPASTPPGCVAQSDNTNLYTWTITNNPAWLTFPQGHTTITGQIGASVLGTAPTVAVPTTYTFTLRFQANQPAAGAGGNGNVADSGPITYTLTINP